MSRSKVFFTLTLLIQCTLKEATSSKCGKSPLKINLPQGEIKGVYDWHKNQIKFLGIPYASIIEKFQAPGKAPSWNDTFNADRGLIQCLQYHQQWKTVIGQENCLVLNVFVPTFQHKKPFPVMVFIHGGDFMAGSSTELIYNPKYLVKEKVIVVTINYRLGALGFLCLPIKEAPGNAGLKDQIAALNWIQNNIGYFGGDPSSVTLFGQGSGGTSINYLILSKFTKGLFHRAIIESGPILLPFSYTPLETAIKVAQHLGYDTSDPDDLFKIYKNTAVDDIIEATYMINAPIRTYAFGPCIETAIKNKRPFITEYPKDSLKNIGLNIPTIIGFNDKEGIQLASQYVPITLKKVNDNFNNMIPAYLNFENETDIASFMNDIVSVYFSNGTATDNLIDYFTDSVFRFSIMSVIDHFSRNPNMSIYNYYYTYDSIRNANKLMTLLPSVPGASNGDELSYLFDQVLYNLPPPDSKNQAMITKMVKIWTSFAKTGVPCVSNVTWRPSGEKVNFIELGEDIKMTIIPNGERIEFWRKVYSKYGR